MATSLTSNFPQAKATEFYLASMLEGATLSTAGITIDNDVQVKYLVRGFDMTNIVQTGETCTWDDGGTTTVTEGAVEVQGFYVNKTECYKDWKYNHNDVKPGQLPAEVITALEQKAKDVIKAKIDADLWKSSVAAATVNGNAYTLNLFDGYCKTLNGSAVEITGVTLSSSNIVAQLGRVYDAMPDAIKSLDNSQKVIFVSHKALGFYLQALTAQGMNTSQEAYKPTYLGIEVRGVSIFDNVIVAGLRSSFHFASNVALDDARIDFIDMSIIGEENARIKASYKYVPAISNKEQVVMYNF